MLIQSNSKREYICFKLPALVVMLIFVFTFTTSTCYGQTSNDNTFSSSVFMAQTDISQFNTLQDWNPINPIMNIGSDYRLDKIIYQGLKTVLNPNYLPGANGQEHAHEQESQEAEQVSDTAAGPEPDSETRGEISESAESEEHEHGEGFWHSLVVPFGIVTFSFLFLTVLSGLFRKKLGRLFMKIHPVLAYITLVLGVCHALLVILT